MPCLPAVEAPGARPAGSRSMSPGEAVEAPPPEVDRHRTRRAACETPRRQARFPADSRQPTFGVRLYNHSRRPPCFRIHHELDHGRAGGNCGWGRGRGHGRGRRSSALQQHFLEGRGRVATGLARGRGIPAPALSLVAPGWLTGGSRRHRHRHGGRRQGGGGRRARGERRREAGGGRRARDERRPEAGGEVRGWGRGNG